MPKGQPQLIVLVGTVGSGKSTQMRLLAESLRKRGAKTREVNLKTNHLLANLLALTLRGNLVDPKRKKFVIGTLIDSRPVILRKMFRLWLALDSISISLRFLFDVKIPIAMGQVVIVEEYLPAIIADYFYISNAINLHPKVSFATTEFLSRVLNSAGPMYVVFLDADNDTLRQRWKLKGRLLEKTEYIRAQRTILLQCAMGFSYPNFLVVDTTTKSVYETLAYIQHFLGFSKVKGATDNSVR